jgi:hypothetical protein
MTAYVVPARRLVKVADVDVELAGLVVLPLRVYV